MLPEIPGVDGFWESLDRLVSQSTVRIDRPQGATHPRYPSFRYPLDYGFLAGTRAADGGGVDVWVGSLPLRTVTAVVCTVELLKRDTEAKLLLGYTHEEAMTVLAIHNTSLQAAILIERHGT